MPKKTKREKIIAEYRRKIQLARASLPPQSSTSPSPVHTDTFQPLTINTGEATDLTTIRKDLFKTLLLAVIAVSVEIGLYWKFR